MSAITLRRPDAIRVNEKEFEVNYFYATAAYYDTIAHKGALNAGTYARIYYYGGEILRAISASEKALVVCLRL